jgi:hypothetical protein
LVGERRKNVISLILYGAMRRGKCLLSQKVQLSAIFVVFFLRSRSPF